MKLEFGEFTLDIEQYELRKGEHTVRLEPKALDLLILLAENQGKVVRKDHILEKIWPGVIVTEASLSSAIAQIRKALGDDGKQQLYLKTVRGRGFRLAMDVVCLDGNTRVDGDIRHTSSKEHQAIPEKYAPEKKHPEQTNPDGRPVLAVLPFWLIGTEDHHNAIAEAIPAELISTISRLRWLRVIARGSSFQYKSSAPNLQNVRRQLGASYVLSGSVELVNSAIAIVVELTDTRDLQIVWSNRYQSDLDRVFEVREEIARDVVSVMEIHVPLNEAQRLVMVPSENLNAWGHYHLGVRHMYRYNSVDNAAAHEHFTKAIELDPHFARAYAGLSYAEFQNHFQRFTKNIDANREQALKFAEQAISLDPLDPLGNLVLGRARWLYGEVESGLTYVEKAIELNPNYSFAHYNSATLNTVLCQGEAADSHVATALSLSPIDPHLQSMWGTRSLAAFVRDDMTAAVDYSQRALAAPNVHIYVLMIAAVVYARIGDLDKARENVNAIKEKSDSFSTKDFLAHFNLRNSSQRQKLLNSLERVGI